MYPLQKEEQREAEDYFSESLRKPGNSQILSRLELPSSFFLFSEIHVLVGFRQCEDVFCAAVGINEFLWSPRLCFTIVWWHFSTRSPRNEIVTIMHACSFSRVFFFVFHGYANTSNSYHDIRPHKFAKPFSPESLKPARHSWEWMSAFKTSVTFSFRNVFHFLSAPFRSSRRRFFTYILIFSMFDFYNTKV